MNCAIINCSNSTYKLKKWRQENCYELNDFYSCCKLEDCIHCIPPFKLYCFPSLLRNAELRNKWIRALKKQNWEETILKWQGFLYPFVGSDYEANSALAFSALYLGYKVEEKKASSTLIRQPLPKKVKLKKMMSMMKMT